MSEIVRFAMEVGDRVIITVSRGYVESAPSILTGGREVEKTGVVTKALECYVMVECDDGDFQAFDPRSPCRPAIRAEGGPGHKR